MQKGFQFTPKHPPVHRHARKRRRSQTPGPCPLAQEFMNVVIRSRFKIEGELVRRSEAWVLRRLDGLSDIMREDFIRMTDLDEEARRRAARLAHRDLPAGQGHLSVDDTAYHALARQTGAVFVTDDRSYIRKLGKMRGWTSSVIALGDLKVSIRLSGDRRRHASAEFHKKIMRIVRLLLVAFFATLLIFFRVSLGVDNTASKLISCKFSRCNYFA